MPGQQSKRVLIVDDELDLVEVLTVLLTASGGFLVAAAGDGESGFARCLSFLPDVILLDISLPGIAGWEFCRRLRADERTRNIPVVIMTTLLTETLQEKVREARAARVLIKPFDEKEIVDVLRSLASISPKVI